GLIKSLHSSLIIPPHSGLIIPPHSSLIKYLHVALDEDWFKLDANLLREALKITPIDQAHQFVSPPSADAIMDFVNQLGYPGEFHFVSRIVVTNLYQPWRAILSMINQCLTGKTSRHHNIHQRSGSPLNLAEDDLSLGNLKFVPKGEFDEVFGMQIPKELITDNIRNAPYYNAYLEILVDEPDEELDQPEAVPKPQGACEEYDLERAIQMSLESFQAQGQAHVGGVSIREPVAEATRLLPMVEGNGKAIATEEQAAQSLLALHTPKRRSTTDQFIFQRQTPTTEKASAGPSAQPQDDTFANIVHETPSPTDAETCTDTKKSDLGKTLESRPPHDRDKMDEDRAGSDPRKSHVALAGPNPEPMHDDFMATVYLKVHESLKFPADEQVILEDPLSSSRTLSFMKILDDTYTFGDQFFNDKSTKDEPGKQNVDAKVVTMVTVPIHQASTSVPPLSTPIIDLSPPKPVASPLLEPLKLAARVTTLEKKFSDFKKKSQTLDNAIQNLGSKVFTLELRDLPHKINQTVNEVVKEAVYIALQAPLRDRFRELPEADMKEILHQRKFKNGSNKSLPEHVALYEAIEASMERENREEFLAEKEKSQKRRRDDQEPPPPPDSYLSKTKRHNFDASGSKQPPALQSSAWKPSDTREAPSSSSKQQFAPHSEQPVKDVPIPDDMEDCHRLLTDQVDLVNPEGHRLVPNVSKPLHIEGPPVRMAALSISKLKATNYLEFRLEELVPSLWIESEHDYNISAAYVKSYMRILCVISIKTFERYSYAFLREIIICRADYNEYKISEADFKNLHPNDFEDLYLLHLQGELNHLPRSDKFHLYNAIKLWIRNIVIRQRVGDLQLGIESYQTTLNLTEPRWDASDFLFKEDYTIVSKPRDVMYRDKNDQKKMLRKNVVHKFSDGILTRVLHKLGYMVKDFRLYQYNTDMENRIWSEDDKRKSEEFMKVIKRRLKI
nr:histone deacetylase 14 [Tanacetum cinerariifolium]